MLLECMKIVASALKSDNEMFFSTTWIVSFYVC